MNDAMGVPHNTAVGWFAPDPRVPDPVWLVSLARSKNLNLNWLLLGEGPELRRVDSSADVWTTLHQTLVEELILHGAPRAEAEQMVPDGIDLYRHFMSEMLEGWTRWDRKQRRLKARSIGAALERVLAGLEPLPRRRALRRGLA